MNRFFIHCMMSSSLLLASFSNYASVGITTKLGTLGAGIEITAPLSAHLNTRFGINVLNLETPDFIHQFVTNEFNSNNDIDFSSNFTFKTFAALFDWHPWRSHFRLSGGLIINQNRMTTNASTQDKFTFGDEDYTGNFNVVATMNFRQIAPYLGIGWSVAPKKSRGWGAAVDLGVMFHGTPEVRLSASGTATRSSDGQIFDVANDPQFQADLHKELPEITDDTDKVKFFPILSFGVLYKF